MDIHAFLSGRRDCTCKKDHPCDIRFVELGEDAMQKLSLAVQPFSHILLVSDGNTYPLCGERVKAALKGRAVDEVQFGKEIVIPNEDAIEKIEQALCPETDLIVGIGSGVINDLCKHVSFTNEMRYIIVATAPSMDGYASVGAALILGGMKVTTTACVPYGIFAEDEVLCSAPVDMLRSGYGDIVGKFSCLNDWKLAHLLRGEYFCDYVYDTVMDTVHRTKDTATAVLARDPAAIRNLMEGLVLVGIMMCYVGNSRPASGSEHHLSHFFEITGILNDTPYYLHGIDVLCAAAVMAQLREKLLVCKPPFNLPLPDAKQREDEIRRIYTSAADGVLALQEKVGFYADLDPALFAARWDEICSLLRAPRLPNHAGICQIHWIGHWRICRILRQGYPS